MIYNDIYIYLFSYKGLINEVNSEPQLVPLGLEAADFLIALAAWIWSGDGFVQFG